MIYNPHPLANIFPLMAADEYVALKNDIRQYGLREAIWILDGQILDGRNRFKACQEVGVTPIFKEYEGDDPTAFVVSFNLKRRHLSESQRAMVAAKLEKYLKAIACDVAQKKSAWIASARLGFYPGDRQPCEVCGQYQGITQAHHVAPLGIQFSKGLVFPIQDFVWLCPSHHVLTHVVLDEHKKGKDTPDVVGVPKHEIDKIATICGRGWNLIIDALVKKGVCA